MKTTKTITVTKEVLCCDFCGNHEEMACNPPACIVCGGVACFDCWKKHFIRMEITRPTAWSTGGYAPHDDHYWCCATCRNGNDPLISKFETLNAKTQRAMKAMREYMDAYCAGLNHIAREVERREKSRNQAEK